MKTKIVKMLLMGVCITAITAVMFGTPREAACVSTQNAVMVKGSYTRSLTSSSSWDLGFRGEIQSGPCAGESEFSAELGHKYQKVDVYSYAGNKGTLYHRSSSSSSSGLDVKQDCYRSCSRPGTSDNFEYTVNEELPTIYIGSGSYTVVDSATLAEDYVNLFDRSSDGVNSGWLARCAEKTGLNVNNITSTLAYATEHEFKLTCNDARKVTFLQIEGGYYEERRPGILTLNGIMPALTPYSREFVAAKWEVPFYGKCGDTVKLDFGSTGGLQHGYLVEITPVFDTCAFQVSSLIGSSTTIDPMSGGEVSITGTISSSSDQSIKWVMNVVDQTFTGTGSNITVVWDGKYADGTVVEPGFYSATLTAQTADGKCKDSKTINLTVTPAPEDQCGLYVEFGSQAHMASGNLSLSQELFSTRSGALPSALTLYYNSLSPHNSSLGRGWSHNYDASLKEMSDGAVIIVEGDWKYQYFTLFNGAYAGQIGNYSTLTKSADRAFTLTRKDGTVYTFGTNGKPTSITDRNGNAQILTYSNDILSTVTDPAGRLIRFAYDDSNHLTSVTDPGGRIYLFSVGAALNSVTQPDSGVWRYAYDLKSFLLSKIDPVGNKATYAYDENHRVTAAIDPEGKVRSIAYPTTGAATIKSTILTEKDGGQWGYTYDTQSGRLYSKKDPQGGVISYTYDKAGNRTSTTLPDGTTTKSTYDELGNLISSTDALNQTTSYTYNAFGQATSIEDPLGNTSKYSYDARGNLISVTDPSGATMEYQYESRGYLTKMTNVFGQATSFVYDSASNLTTVTLPTGATTAYTYDAVGNMTSQTDPNGAVTRFAYDHKNRLVAVTNPAGSTTTYGYDLNGNRTSTTDANGKTTTNSYNSQGQLIRTIDALGNVTTYAYGGIGCPSCGGGTGKLTSLTDANGNSTTYQYDSLGRILWETDALGNRTVYAYDSNGNMVAKTDANGATTKFQYDGAGRVVKKTYEDDTTTTFTYDANGNILAAANADAAYAFNYDAVGRTLSVTDATGKTIQYSYDRAGRKAKTSKTSPTRGGGFINRGPLKAVSSKEYLTT